MSILLFLFILGLFIPLFTAPLTSLLFSSISSGNIFIVCMITSAVFIEICEIQ